MYNKHDTRAINNNSNEIKINDDNFNELDNNNEDIESSKSFICMPDTNSEIVIILERVAFIESMGRINRDGYCLSGWRRRIHYRKRKIKN
jgi:hypothetical protein